MQKHAHTYSIPKPVQLSLHLFRWQKRCIELIKSTQKQCKTIQYADALLNTLTSERVRHGLRCIKGKKKGTLCIDFSPLFYNSFFLTKSKLLNGYMFFLKFGWITHIFQLPYCIFYVFFHLSGQQNCNCAYNRIYEQRNTLVLKIG